jgi:2-polyprenyl-6-methoxyphenol hydroxylase-like FAD-dependent oxidoreductase
MADPFDAIIVGARCAGAPTAMLLARQGFRVLLVDRDAFPSDTLSTHYIHQPGIAALKRWGLLEAVHASGCPPIRRLRFDVGPFALLGAPAPAGDVEVGYAPRRRVLDKILVDAAVAAGVEIRERFTVDDLVWDGNRVAGLSGHSGSTPATERASIVIGADGLHSMIARKVQAAATNEAPPFTCAYYSYWSGVPMEDAELYVRPDRCIITAPTNDGQTLAISYWPRAMFDEVRKDIEGHFWAALELVPGLAERLRAGQRSEPFRGSGDLPFFVRKRFGPGWALAGDAACYRDPITALGITHAFEDAEALATAVAAGLSGESSLDDALARYETARNEAVMPAFGFTQQLASLEPPPPEMQQLFGALLHNPAQTSRFFGAIAGTVPIPEFFDPANIGAIVRGQAGGA